MDEHELIEVELGHEIYRERLLKAYRRIALEQARCSQANSDLVAVHAQFGEAGNMPKRGSQPLQNEPLPSETLPPVEQDYEQLELF